MDVQEFCFDPSVGSIKWGYQNDVDAYVILAFDKLKAGTQFPLRETKFYLLILAKLEYFIKGIFRDPQ